MKEVLYFLKWQIKRWTFFDVLWTLSFGLFGAGFMEKYLHPEGPIPWQLIAGVVCWTILMFKMMIVDLVRNSWDRYQQEKAKLLADLGK